MNNMLILVIALFAGLLTLLKFDISKESFVNVPMSVVVDKEVKTPMGMFSVPGNYQAMLPPRFSNTSYGALLRSSLPSIEMQGVPQTPLDFSQLVQASGKMSASSTASNGSTVPEPTPSQVARMSAGSGSMTVTDILPSGDMTMMSASGDVSSAPIVYDRFIYSTGRSRLYGLGDPIRGDLPIMPCSESWMRPSVSPQIDLRSSALAILGGKNNATGNELAAFKAAFTHSVDRADTSTTQFKNSYVSSAGGDIQISSFP